MGIKDHFEGKRDLGLIDPRKLTVDPEYNVRNLDKPEAREALDYLKSLIRVSGVQSPLRIREDNEKLIIVRGHRRHKVVMELIEEGHPIKLVPVTQEPRGTTPADRNWDLIDSNSEEPLKGFERADALYRQIHTFGWDEKEILRRTGKTQQWLNQQLELRTISPEVKQMVDNKEVSLTTARIATKEHGPQAPAVIRAAKAEAEATGKKNSRATPRAVAKVTGKKPSAHTKENASHFLDFVNVAGKLQDEVAAAGGIDRVTPDKIAAFTHGALTVLAKVRGKEPPAAPKQEQEQQPAPTPEPPAGQRYEPMFDDRPPVTAAAPTKIINIPGPINLATKQVLDVLSRFATIAEDNNVGERPDDYVIEVSAGDLKRAWEVFQSVTGNASQEVVTEDAA